MKASMLRFALPAFCVFAAQLPGQPAAQPPAGPIYSQNLTFLKVAPGKTNDFLRMTREETMKLAQVRADAGEILTWTLLRSVYPAGQEARADFILSTLTEGPPRPPSGNAGLEADLKKAGVKISTDDYWAKRTGVVTRVASELWRIRERLSAPQKGSFISINFFSKVTDGPAFNDFNSKVYRPLAESRLKDGQISGWLYATKSFPAGPDTGYLAYRANIFPTWAAAFATGSQGSMQARFEKVHPGKSWQEFVDNTRGGKLSTLGKIELWEVVERVEKSKK